MQRYVVQTHIHGSCSEGQGSYAAHDYAASQAGYVDLIWWHDHDWRVANFVKVQDFSFDNLEEIMDIPNRNPQADAPTTPIKITWEPVAGNDPAGQLDISSDVVHSGTGAFRLAIPAGDSGRQFMYELKAEVFHQRYPLLSYPLIQIAVQPGEGDTGGGFPCIRLQLSQQPPDLEPVFILYKIGQSGPAHLEGKVLEIPFPLEQSGWVELTLDPASDVQRYHLQGGLDNSLYAIQIGMVSGGPEIAAYFDSLHIQPQFSGTECLKKQRQLISNAPLQKPSLVGIEVSYYGQHINAYGSQVPIPDYEGTPRSAFNSRFIVDHIHRYGGLACLNHPHVGKLTDTIDTLVKNQAYEVDLMEIAHGNGGLLERLTLLDRLAAYGFTLTGIAASDAHGANSGWGIQGKAPAWVNHIWSTSLDEADLLEALSLGRVYIADPQQFQGTLALTGPDGVMMGDVVECTAFPPLTCHIEGLHPDDIVLWVVNGLPAHASIVEGTDYHKELTPKMQLHGLVPIRVQVIRPSLATAAYEDLIVVSNPIYCTNSPLPTRHRQHLVV